MSKQRTQLYKGTPNKQNIDELHWDTRQSKNVQCTGRPIAFWKYILIWSYVYLSRPIHARSRRKCCHLHHPGRHRHPFILDSYLGVNCSIHRLAIFKAEKYSPKGLDQRQVLPRIAVKHRRSRIHPPHRQMTKNSSTFYFYIRKWQAMSSYYRFRPGIGNILDSFIGWFLQRTLLAFEGCCGAR